jgi:hypothetical protein
LRRAKYFSPSLGGRTSPETVSPVLRGDVDVVRTGEVVVIHRTEESEAVRKDLQDAGAGDDAVFLGLGLQDGKNQVLSSHAAGARNFQLVGQLCQFTDRLSLDIFDVHFRFL